MMEQVHAEWLLPDHVQLITVQGRLSAGTMFTYDRALIAQMDIFIESPLHVVFDIRETSSFPSLSDCMRLQYMHHARLGWQISIGASKHILMQFLTRMRMRVIPFHYKDCHDLEEAVAFLQKQDLALPPFALPQKAQMTQR